MNNITIKILVLDDEPFMLKLIGRMLADLGYESRFPPATADVPRWS